MYAYSHWYIIISQDKLDFIFQRIINRCYFPFLTDPVYLIQPVANNGQFGNARVQPIMIMKLAGM